LVTFDPNYNYDVAGGDVDMEDEEGGGWGDEIDEEDWGNADDDDTSWKVRRASVKLIDAILNSRPDKLREIYRNYAS
jgi:cullin-associated NEDD8-dissociated protein 1